MWEDFSTNKMSYFDLVCLTTNKEVASSILGTYTILKVDQVWKGAHPASCEQLGKYLTEVADLIMKVGINGLDVV